AIRQLESAERVQVLKLVRHPRDCEIIEQVRLPLEWESALFELIDTVPPARRRQVLANQFSAAAVADIPECWRREWQSYCSRLETVALDGGSIDPFSHEDPCSNEELLQLIPKLLWWEGESLIRFVSCVVCGDSKRLDVLRTKLETALNNLSHGRIKRLDGLGILETPRTCLIHGPLRLLIGSQWLDLGNLVGAIRLSTLDLTAAAKIETTARRCITIENETTFHELAKLRCGDLLIQTSYPGSGTLKLVQRLAEDIEFWHFGDSDPIGFDILRDLRERSGRPVQSLHMSFRPGHRTHGLTKTEGHLLERLLQSAVMQPEKGHLSTMLAANSKGQFEQESLGRPELASWPFYRF
ncbi:MAG: DUF2220 family protein, partial [Acidobacteria bacterium]|nr:DUF2220 family protein [Acidobacteriota bacterium]